MIGPAIAKMDHGYDSMADAMNEAGEEGSLSLHHKISYVALIANIAPMLGLLGTVWGMVQTFLVFASKPGATAADLAPGISQALMTTVMGLVVAIPMMIVFQFFRNRVLRPVLGRFVSHDPEVPPIVKTENGKRLTALSQRYSVQSSRWA